MVLVRVADKRTHKGYRIKYFNCDGITDEVIQFVQDTPKSYWIDCMDKVYYDRNEFLAEFQKDRKKGV